MTSSPHLGWRKWRRLPHFDEPGQVQHIVFRLSGSIPREAIEAGLRAEPARRLEAYEAILDRGDGPRHLADPCAALIVERTLLAADGERYDLLAWCVMPTHVHVLIFQREGWPLHRVVGEWKSISARRIKSALGLGGSVWARDYFDRAMRSESQTEVAGVYIEDNPVKAGLCEVASEWRWSSAFEGTLGRSAPPPTCCSSDAFYCENSPTSMSSAFEGVGEGADPPGPLGRSAPPPTSSSIAACRGEDSALR